MQSRNKPYILIIWPISEFVAADSLTLPVLLPKEDSGLDSAKLLFTVAAEKNCWTAIDRRFVYLTTGT